MPNLKFKLEDLTRQIEEHEGRRDTMYKDSKGHLTIGVGHKLEGNPIPQEAIDIILRADIYEAIEETLKLCIRENLEWEELPPIIQETLVEMVFQMGTSRVRGFKFMLEAARAENWKAFRFEMLDSKWARTDSPARACKLADKVMGLWQNF